LNARDGSQFFKQKIPVENRTRFGASGEIGASGQARRVRITGVAQMQNSSFLLSEDSAMERPRWRLWRGRALSFSLISASAAALLLCPCDCPGQNLHAIFLIAVSALLGGGAAALVYRELRRRSEITAFLKAVIAMGIVVFGVYAEFTVAMDLIAWLARRGR
jgi:hypothetical protein